jgi:hypothetical protein
MSMSNCSNAQMTTRFQLNTFFMRLLFIMGQSSSRQTTQRFDNFYHVCNVIPDIPQPHHQIWAATLEKSAGAPAAPSVPSGEEAGEGGMPMPLPPLLDRRYDIDVAPSMLNMNLKYNGAYMVVANLYNILLARFGYKHMLSIQMLFWHAVQTYYQIADLSCLMNYKLSISSFLEVVQNQVLCSEKEMSIYEKDFPSTGDQQTTSAPNAKRLHANRRGRPFYSLQYYYVPKTQSILKQALFDNHLILANLTLFANFLNCHHGIIQPPGERDKSAGMIVITLVGYQEQAWIARFPFGIHWGDRSYGYVPFDYFDRYCRDRWIMTVDTCSVPPSQRAANTSSLPVEMPMSPRSAAAAAHDNDSEYGYRAGRRTSFPHEYGYDYPVAASAPKEVSPMRRRLF